MKIKISKVDELFSKQIRERDNWTCQRCGRQFTPPTQGLHCSHFWGRSNKATRFDPQNCDALCYGCHIRWESNKQGEYRDWKIKQLGEESYNKLERRARSTVKFGAWEQKQLYDQLSVSGLRAWRLG